MHPDSLNEAAAQRGCTITGVSLHDRSSMLAWSAGLFEGEGCISLARQRNQRGRYQVWLVCFVRMVDPEPIQRLHQIWGGRVYLWPPEPRRRPIHSWRLSTRQTVPFLEAIQPLVSSSRLRDRIALALAFQTQKGQPASHVALPAYRERQDAFHRAMRSLNLRGDHALSPDGRAAILADFGLHDLQTTRETAA